MKKLLKFLTTLIIGLLIFIIMMKIVGWERIEEALGLFLSFKGLIILVLTLAAAFIGIIKWRFVLTNLMGSEESKFKGLGKIWLAGFATTYLLTPMAGLGGEPVRVYFAKKNYNLNWQKSIASVIIDRIFDWTIFSIFTIAGIFTLLFYTHLVSSKIIVLAIMLVSSLLFFILFFYFKALKKESTLIWFLKALGIKKEKLEGSKNGKVILEIEKELIDFFSVKKKQFWQGISLSFLRYSLFLLRAIFLILFLTGGVNLIQGLGIYGFTNIAEIFPTPASLGSLEATGILSFRALGFTMASGTIFAMVLRGANLILCLIGILFLIKLTIKLTGDKFLGFVKKIKKM